MRIASIKTKLLNSAKFRHLGEFFIAQTIVQALTLTSGFLFVRLLSLQDYAQYSVVYGAMSSASVLTDIGISGTLVSLVGVRVANFQLIADYVQTIRRLRRMLFIALAPVTAIAFPVVIAKQHWSSSVVMEMLLCLLTGVWFNAVSSSYGAALILRGDRKCYYKVQAVGAITRLLLLTILSLTHYLNAVTGVGTGVLLSIFVGTRFYLRSRALLSVRGTTNSQLTRQVIHLALPNVPTAVFYALQGQLSVFLITIFGHSNGIAGVGALSRLGQLFIFFSQMNPLLIEPYFAKLPADKFKSNYLIALAIGVTIIVFAITVSLLWPQLLLCLLGGKYRDLKQEVVWTVAGSAVSYVSGVLWIIHLAKRFVFWWTSGLTIVTTIAIQVAFALKSDLSTVKGVVLLGFTTSLAAIVVNILAGLTGIVKGPRTLGSETAVPNSTPIQMAVRSR